VRIALLGLGRLGRSLLPLLREAGHEVLTWRRGEPVPLAPVAWIVVPDQAIASVAALVPPGAIVLHASGLLGIDVLRPHRPAGSLHPVQTFPGPEIATPSLLCVPAAVAGDAEAVATASDIARSLGMVPVAVPGDRRLYHAACVLAGNFPAVLMVEASRLLEQAGVSPQQARRMLLPLAMTAVNNAADAGADALTGPHIRADEAAILAHRRALLEKAPQIVPLYDTLGERARKIRG
jgi:predicted short-subunit dehydrogenase-like oxidoreductase (DUF2520 family)